MLSALSLIVRWMARGIAILIAAAFLVFLAGVHSGPMRSIDFRDWMGMALLIGAVAAMLLAWKWELPGAVISLFALAAFAVVIPMRSYDALIGPAVPGALFLIDWKLRHIHCRQSRT
jgi:hypothetical protein